MGDNPSDSAVNKYLQVWGTPNVFSLGAGAFPQNAGYNPFPVTGTPVLPGTCNAQGVGTVSDSFYSCPSGLGIVTHTIGSPRQIQMSLSFMF